MARQCFFSPLNPFAMRELEYTRLAQYHRGHIDTDLQSELLLSWQIPAIYEQKVERGDYCRFAFDVTDAAGYFLQIVDCAGVPVYLFPGPAASTDLPDNITADGSQLHSHLFRRADYSVLPDDGTYRLLLTVTYALDYIKRYISEPFSVADHHPDTMLIQYRNSRNKDGLHFEQLPMFGNIRVEAYIDKLKPLSADTVYEDQQYNLELLSSTAYRSWTLQFGETGEGLPDWMILKLSQIFTCDAVYLDGKQYRRNAANATLEPEDSGNNPLKSATLAIREANNTEGYTFADKFVKLFIPPAPPYVLSLATLSTGSSTVQLSTADYVVNDGPGETAMIAAINAQIPNQELFGTVSKVGGVIGYTNGTGENFISGQVTLFTTFIGFNFVSPGPIGSGPGTIYPTQDLSFRRGSGLIEWGDGAKDAFEYSLSPTIVSHIYTGAAGTRAVRVWGRMEDFAIPGGGYRSGLTGTLPAGLKSLSLDFGTFPGNTFQFSYLAPVLATLESLSITNSALTGAPGFNTIYFPKLRYIDFSGNAFSGNSMSLLTRDVHYNATHQIGPVVGSPVIYGGIFSVGQQTTGGLLNASGNNYKALLEALSWTIYV